jgi:hypothetical protein
MAEAKYLVQKFCSECVFYLSVSEIICLPGINTEFFYALQC